LFDYEIANQEVDDASYKI